MDLDAVRLLLESQERAFRSALDLVVEQLKSRIQKMEGTMTDLIKSLEFSQAEVLDLKNESKVLRKADSEKQSTIEALQTSVAELQRRANYQEDYSRRNNLRISGLQEQPVGESWEQTSANVTKLLEDKLQLSSVKLDRAHRVGSPSQAQPRSIVVRFEKYGEREAVLRNAKKLKGTGIFINEDLCPASLEIKRNQYPLLKKAREEGKIAFFRHTRLIVRERREETTSPSFQAASSLLSSGGSLARNERVGTVNRPRSVVASPAGSSTSAGSAGSGKEERGAGDTTSVLPSDGAAVGQSSGSDVALSSSVAPKVSSPDGAEGVTTGAVGVTEDAGKPDGGAITRQHKSQKDRKKK